MATTGTSLVRPAELLDHQRELAAWWSSERGAWFGGEFIQLAMRAPHPNDVGFLEGATGKLLADQEAYGLVSAEPFWVSEEMLALTWQAAETMPGQPLHEGHLACPSGFAYFAAPLYPYPDHDAAVLRAVRWHATTAKNAETGRHEAGVMVTWYAAPEDGGYAEHPEDVRWLGPPLILLHLSFLPYGRTPQEGLISGEEADAEAGSWNWFRFVAAMWTLMQQRIAHTTVVRPERHQRKRAARAGLAAARGGVRVITLRRELPDPAAGESVPHHREVNWRSRWVVSGHWRNQPYKDGYRLIFIDPYVKGPEGLPLKFSDHVFKWTR
jgi:hypothetical protein